MPEVTFKVRFMDWRPGDKVNLSKGFAQKYIKLGVCDAVRPPAKRKRRAAPNNKMAAGAANK
jgi:hypothetical protein